MTNMEFITSNLEQELLRSIKAPQEAAPSSAALIRCSPRYKRPSELCFPGKMRAELLSLRNAAASPKVTQFWDSCGV